MTAAPARTWWTPAEIADRRLPDLPGTKRGVQLTIEREGWAAQPGKARRRAGRGGGWEYHWSLFPLAAQKALLAEGARAPEAAPRMARDEAWRWFEALPDAVKDRARARLTVLGEVGALEGAGLSRQLAVAEVARRHGVGARSVWSWFALVDGVRLDDRLPYLAPRHRAGAKAAPRAECSPEFWDVLKADYLRLEQPSFTACYRRAVRVAREQGWDILPERTMRRRLHAEVSPAGIVLARKGMDALKAMYPAQTRDKTALHAMEAVNADFHKFDVFVRWPRYEGDNEGEIVRPQMVAFQDIHSGRILSWRVDRTPNKTAVALAMGDMIETFGIPDHVLFDNGREFANKFLTGQSETRFRFKVKDDDIPGLLEVLGCTIHWATPYSGQSKPIERAFRDLCDDVAKDPRFAGAWTGNRPDAKPENYGSRAIPLDRFLDIVAEGIEAHNARPGRRSDTARGRSFIETFEASYAEAPIRKATEEQRRLWLMGAEGLRADSRTGQIKLMGNTYWADWLHMHRGEKLVARFDPGDLWSGLYLYTLEGAYLGQAECHDKKGFLDVDEARHHARVKRAFRKAEEAALEAALRLKIADVSAYLDGAAPPAPRRPAEAKVVRPVFKPALKAPVPAPAPADPRVAEQQAAMVASLDAARAKAPPREDSARDRFARALELDRRAAAGEAVADEDRRWLARYRETPEYRAQHRLYQDFGDAMFG